ncbi:MAG: cytochrome ubiquinol oxidase subunit I [Actinobacteria bacterium]|nr:cytochrome ubiquinol oxidase subunit I [Actinomycetota bacterium]
MDALVAVLGAEPSQLLPARTQMAFTLGFHIILVPMGVAFTFITLLAHYRGLKHDDEDALRLAQRWSKVAAVLFAVGAVTGTVLTFEMGLLWPRLMGKFGDAYGIPFAIEGLFFFLEAIFIAIYIYGWKRLPRWPHFFTGIPVVLAGIGGTLSVVAANAWMNTPDGFTLRNGKVTDVDVGAVIFTDAFWHESLHMLLAAYLVAGFMVASVYAYAMLRGRRDRHHRLGFLFAFSVAAVVMPLQIVVGDLAAREVFKQQPIKFAAQELVYETQRNAPEVIGGILVDGEVKYGIKIPGLASFLADYDTNTKIIGLESVPERDRPPANIVHLAFNTMVGIAFALLALSAWFGIALWRKRELPKSPWFLRGAVAAGALSVVAMEAGWVVTEVGRQPWVIQGILRTEDAVTRAGGIWISLAVVVVLYALVGTATILVLRGMARRWRTADAEETPVPYGPRP